MRLALGVCVALFSAAAEPDFAAETGRTDSSTNSVSRQDYSDFKIITDRNIFNQHRYARSGSPPRDTRRASRVDSITLVGTMIYDKGVFAFFEGSRSDYRKVLTNNSQIADYKVTQIGNSFVNLASGTNVVKLPVGMQLRREDEGPWQVATPPQTIASFTPPSGSSSFRNFGSPRPSFQSGPPQSGSGTVPQGTEEAPVIVIDPSSQSIVIQPGAIGEGTATNAVPPADAGGGDNDVLRRLMQRREQEMNR